MKIMSFSVERSFQAHEVQLNAAAYSSTGTRLATIDDQNCVIWDTTTWTITNTLFHPDARHIFLVCWHPSQPHIATATTDTIHLWNTETRTNLLKLDMRYPTFIEWLPQDKLICGDPYGNVHIYSSEGRILYVYKLADGFTHISKCIPMDSEHFVLVSANTALALHRVTCYAQQTRSHLDVEWVLEQPQACGRVSLVDGCLYIALEGMVQVVDLNTREMRTIQPPHDEGSRYAFLGKFLGVLNDDGDFYVVDMDTNTIIYELEDETLFVDDAILHPNTHQMITFSRDGMVTVWML